MAPFLAPVGRKWTKRCVPRNGPFQHGPKHPLPNARLASNVWQTQFTPMPTCWQKLRQGTTGSPCHSQPMWTFHAPRKTCVFMHLASSISQARAIPWKAKPSITPCASRWVWLRALALGICHSTFSLGRWLLLWPRAIALWPNPRKSPQLRLTC